MSRSNPDFTIQNEGSIFLLQPHSFAARAWVDKHIGQGNGYQPYWPTVLVEHRYVVDIVDGIQADGLTVA